MIGTKIFLPNTPKWLHDRNPNFPCQVNSKEHPLQNRNSSFPHNCCQENQKHQDSWIHNVLVPPKTGIKLEGKCKEAGRTEGAKDKSEAGSSPLSGVFQKKPSTFELEPDKWVLQTKSLLFQIRWRHHEWESGDNPKSQSVSWCLVGWH